MRMARVNISIPDELYRQAKDSGVNISRLARKAISSELDDLARIAAVDRYLSELEAEFGAVAPAEQARADAAVDAIIAGTEDMHRSA